MKKIFLVMAALLVMAGSADAQNQFRGTVKYKLESVGKVAMQIPAEQSTMEVKIYDDQALSGNTIQNGMRISTCADFSPYLSYLAAQDISLDTYTGDGKFLIRQTMTEAAVDSLTIVDTEPEHFYMEYVEGETQQICGMTAKKAIFHNFDEAGVDEPFTIWYSDELGPKYNFLFNPIVVKGLPLQFVLNQGDGKAISVTATDIVKGKVKETDMLLPAGYKEATEEEFENFQKELKEAIELLEE